MAERRQLKNLTFDEILFDIREEYGTRIFDDPPRLKALLSDLAREYKKETVVLDTILVNTGAAKAIKECDDSTAVRTMSRLMADIMGECGYDEETTRHMLDTLLLVIKKRRLSEDVRVIRGRENEKSIILPELTQGNSAGNIVNGGRVCNWGEWLFYSNKSHDGRLYKARGDLKICLNAVRSHYINIAGEWLYFSNRSDKCRLYALNIVDNRQIMVCADGCSYVNVIGGRIYYKNTDDGKIYSVNPDGRDRKKVSDDRGFYINVINNWVYYSNWDDDLRVYKIAVDGSQRSRLNLSRSFHLNVSDGFIYYSNRTFNNNIYKMPITGGYEIPLNQNRSGHLNVDGGWIFYSNESDDDKPYKIRTDGSDNVKLNEDSCSNINLAGGWVYYINPDSYFNLFKIRTDGTGRRRVL